MFTASMAKRLINFYSYKKAQDESEEEQVADSVTGEVRPVSEMHKGNTEGNYLTEETFNRLFDIASLLSRSYLYRDRPQLIDALINDDKEHKISELQPVVDISGNWLHTIRQTDPSKVKKTIEGIMSSDKEMCVTDANEAPFWDFSNYRRFALVLSGTCRVLWNADVYSAPLGNGSLGSSHGLIEYINEMTEGWIIPSKCEFLGVLLNDNEPVPEEVYSILEQEGIPILTHAEVATDHEYIDTKFYSKDDEYLDHFTCDVNDPESSYDIPEIDEEFYNMKDTYDDHISYDPNDPEFKYDTPIIDEQFYHKIKEDEYYNYDTPPVNIEEIINTSLGKLDNKDLLQGYINADLTNDALEFIDSLSEKEIAELIGYYGVKNVPEDMVEYIFTKYSDNEDITAILIQNRNIPISLVEKFPEIIHKQHRYIKSNREIDINKMVYILESVLSDEELSKIIPEVLYSNDDRLSTEVMEEYEDIILTNKKLLNSLINNNESLENMPESIIEKVLLSDLNTTKRLVIYNYPFSKELLERVKDSISISDKKHLLENDNADLPFSIVYEVFKNLKNEQQGSNLSKTYIDYVSRKYNFTPEEEQALDDLISS